MRRRSNGDSTVALTFARRLNVRHRLLQTLATKSERLRLIASKSKVQPSATASRLPIGVEAAASRAAVLSVASVAQP